MVSSPSAAAVEAANTNVQATKTVANVKLNAIFWRISQKLRNVDDDEGTLYPSSHVHRIGRDKCREAIIDRALYQGTVCIYD